MSFAELIAAEDAGAAAVREVLELALAEALGVRLRPAEIEASPR